MKLIIKRVRRDDTTFFLGTYKGSDFVVQCQLELTKEERAIINRCRLDDYGLTTPELPETEMPTHTIGTLHEGLIVNLPDADSVIHYIDALKGACDQLPRLLDLYGPNESEEIIEYPRGTQQN